jgi:hypothetical protein
MPIKTQFNVSLPPSTADAVRARAQEADVNVNDLTDLFLRYGLERMPVELLRKWASSQATSRSLGPLTKNERKVLGAFEKLRAKPDNDLAWKWNHLELAIEAGLRHAVGYDALKSLEERGLVVVLSEGEAVDRWNRPVKSYWGLLTQMPEREVARLKRAA